jgi:hypothetical protein
VGGLTRIQESTVPADNPDAPQISNNPVREQIFYKGVNLEAMWRRAKHGHEFMVLTGSFQHGHGIGEVACHAGLTKHVFAGAQSGHGHRRMEKRRGPDPHNINVRPVNEFLPVCDGFRFQRKFLTKFLAASQRGIRDGHNFSKP